MILVGEIRQEIDLQLVGSFGDYTEGYEEGFIKGAKWADKTMIERACKWLINIDFDGDHNFRDCDESFAGLGASPDRFVYG